MTARNPLWLADTEGGIAHARSHGPAPRTACGKVAIAERHAYPPSAAGHCAVCVSVVKLARRDKVVA